MPSTILGIEDTDVKKAGKIPSCMFPWPLNVPMALTLLVRKNEQQGWDVKWWQCHVEGGAIKQNKSLWGKGQRVMEGAIGLGKV